MRDIGPFQGCISETVQDRS